MDSRKYPTKVTNDTNSDVWKARRKKDLETEKFLEIYTGLGKKIHPVPGQSFVILIYLLQNPPKDGVHGMIFPVSVHSTYETAKNKAEQICREHQVDVCRIYPMAKWRYIAEKAPTSQVKYAPSDSELKRFEADNHQKKVAVFKKEVEIRDKIEEEHLKSDQPGSIEHYTYCWYRAVKHKSKIEYLKKQLAETEKSYQEEVTAIRADHQSDPSLDEKWLEVLKSKLEEREEQDVYSAVVTGYKHLRDEIIGNQKGT